jgi:hypothetical protein
MCTQTPHGGVGLDRHRERLPGLAVIFSALNRAGAARRIVAEADKHRGGVAGLDQDTAAIYVGEDLAGADRAPGGPLIGAQEDVIVRCGPDGFDRSATRRHTVHVHVGEALMNLFPCFASVRAAADAVDLDTGPERLWVIRIDDQTGDAWNANSRALLGEIDRELLPALSPIGRTKNGRGARPGIHHLWLAWMDCQGPDVKDIQRALHPRPACPGVVAAIQAAVGTREQHLWTLRMDGKRPDFCFEGDTLRHARPALATVGAVPNALPYCADANVGALCHDLTLLVNRPFPPTTRLGVIVALIEPDESPASHWSPSAPPAEPQAAARVAPLYEATTEAARRKPSALRKLGVDIRWPGGYAGDKLSHA